MAGKKNERLIDLTHARWREVGERLTRLLEASGRTQDELAAAMGMKRPNLTAALAGRRSINAERVSRAAAFLEVQAHEIDPAFESSVRRIPLAGEISAGLPVEAYEQKDRYIMVPADWALPKKVFAIYVRGDSMRDAGIYDGDFVIVREAKTGRHGDIVAFAQEGQTALRRLHEDDRRHGWLVDEELNPRRPRERPGRAREAVGASDAVHVLEGAEELELAGSRRELRR